MIANFENVCAGSSNDYKNEYLLYNCPDQFVKDMKSSGIDFVTTANNHCLDQGIEGLKEQFSRLINRTKLRLGISYFKPYTDKIQDQDTANRYLDQIEKDIIKAKCLSDIVVACLHIGGQFNEEPGEYSKFIVDFFCKKGRRYYCG